MDLKKLKGDMKNKQYQYNNFLNDNIQLKIKDLDVLHMIILKKIYDLAEQRGCLENENLCQCEVDREFFNKVKEEIPELDRSIYLICMKDLEEKGFIFNVQSNPYKEWAYAITTLGIECIKVIEEV